MNLCQNVIVKCEMVTMGKRRSKNGSLASVIIMVVVSVGSFFAGSLWSLQATVGQLNACSKVSDIGLEEIVAKRVQQGRSRPVNHFVFGAIALTDKAIKN